MKISVLGQADESESFHTPTSEPNPDGTRRSFAGEGQFTFLTLTNQEVLKICASGIQGEAC